MYAAAVRARKKRAERLKQVAKRGKPKRKLEKHRPEIPFVEPVDKDYTKLSPLENLENLLSPVSLPSFFEEYWEKKPLVLHRNGECKEALFSISDFFRLVSSGDIQYGRHVHFCRYTDGKRVNFPGTGAVATKNAERLWNRKQATIQFHQPQHFKDSIWQLLTQLETVFGCLVGANVYMTPPNSQGLAPHYDDVEVIILQLEGKKHWRLYAPPTILPQDYSRDLSQEEIGPPTHDLILEAGDLLYFPRGTVHQADTPPGIHSTHITISTYQQNSWSNLIQTMLPFLLKQITQSQFQYRQGLPVNIISLSHGYQDNFTTQSLMKMSQDLVSSLDGSICDTILLQTLESYSLDFICSRLPPFHKEEEEIGPQGPIPSQSDVIKLCWPDYTYLHTYCTGDHVIVYHSLANKRTDHMVMNDSPSQLNGIKFPRHFEVSLQRLFATSSSGIVISSLPLLTEEELTHLVLSLWSDGLISVVKEHLSVAQV